MKNKKIFILFPFMALFWFSFGAGERLYAADKLSVVTSTTLYESLAKAIGGDRVKTDHVAPPKFNIHFVQPRPSDVRKVAKADLFVFTGLDIEPWADPLLEAAGKPELFRGGVRNVDLSRGVRLLEVPEQLDRSLGDLHIFGNPHIWMSPENVRVMAKTLAASMRRVDPVNSAVYDENEKKFEAEFDRKMVEWKRVCAHCAGKEMVSYHKDIVYFADFLGIQVHMYLESKPGIPPTPKHLAEVERSIRERGVNVIVMPSFYARDTAEEVARRTGASVVILPQSVGEVPGTDDVFAFFDHNVRSIAEALK